MVEKNKNKTMQGMQPEIGVAAAARPSSCSNLSFCLSVNATNYKSSFKFQTFSEIGGSRSVWKIEHRSGSGGLHEGNVLFTAFVRFQTEFCSN